MARVNAYKIQVPLVPGAREEWKSRVCQARVEAFIRERGLPSSQNVKPHEHQAWRDVLSEQKGQQKKLNQEKTRQTPSKGFGLEL